MKKVELPYDKPVEIDVGNSIDYADSLKVCLHREKEVKRVNTL